MLEYHEIERVYHETDKRCTMVEHGERCLKGIGHKYECEFPHDLIKAMELVKRYREDARYPSELVS